MPQGSDEEGGYQVIIFVHCIMPFECIFRDFCHMVVAIMVQEIAVQTTFLKRPFISLLCNKEKKHGKF